MRKEGPDEWEGARMLGRLAVLVRSGDPWNRRVERRRRKEGEALAIEGVWRSSNEGRD